MSDLTPSMLALDKGLDLQTAKIIAPPGSVLDSLNYEQVDFQGQKRIEGYARYDGSALTAIDEFYVLETSETAAAVGDMLLKDGDVFGVVGAVSGNIAYYVRVNSALEIFENDALQGAYVDNGAYTTYSLTVVQTTPGKESGITQEQHYTRLLEIMTALRPRVEALPGRIIGLHWFKDRLYSVADTAFIVLSSSETVYPNDVLTIGGTNYNVFDAYTTDAGQIILLQAGDVDFTSQNVDRNGTPLGIVNSVVYPDTATPVATIFESRTEQQVIDEDLTSAKDFGWRAKHLGWVVDFRNGTALYGKLAAVNQNRQNVGIEGPTSTAGTDGSPSGLFQKVNILNRPPQVNGWKSFDSPGAYILDPSDVQQLDANFIYADAFVSWTGDSATVTAPGSDMNGLVEYSPTNSIVFTPLP